ncbi:MAG: GEVED domain-containing protein, partial [Bacteroidota bacterium]
FMMNFAPPATVVTDLVENITVNSATLNGTFNANGAATFTWFDYGLTTNYTNSVTGNPVWVNDNSNVSVPGDIINLEPNTTYHYRARGTRPSWMDVNGGDATFTTLKMVPWVYTDFPTNVSSVSALLRGAVNGENDATAVTFEYCTDGTFTLVSTITGFPNNFADNQLVSANLTGLTPGTQYYYRLIGTNGGGTTIGNPQSFTTSSNPYCLPAYSLGCTNGAGITHFAVTSLNQDVTCTGTTDAYQDFTYESVDLTQLAPYQLSVVPGADNMSVTFWIDYNGDYAFTPSEKVGSFHCAQAGVTSTYNFQVPVSAGIITTRMRIMTNSWGDYSDFPSDPCSTSEINGNAIDLGVNIYVAPVVPTAVTLPATNITRTTATINGTVNPNDPTWPVDVVFEGGLTDSYGQTAPGVPYGFTGYVDVAVSAALTNLTPGTTYHYRATATNISGTNNGADESFTTSPDIVITTAGVTAIDECSAVSGGSVSDDPTLNVSERGVCWGNSPNPTILADNFTVDGSGTGDFVSNITGLSFGTTYHVRAYATDELGTAYGNDISFVTPSISITGNLSVCPESTTNLGCS